MTREKVIKRFYVFGYRKGYNAGLVKGSQP